MNLLIYTLSCVVNFVLGYACAKAYIHKHVIPDIEDRARFDGRREVAERNRKQDEVLGKWMKDTLTTHKQRYIALLKDHIDLRKELTRVYTQKIKNIKRLKRNGYKSRSNSTPSGRVLSKTRKENQLGKKRNQGPV
jgi:hypothetical protein